MLETMEKEKLFSLLSLSIFHIFDAVGGVIYLVWTFALHTPPPPGYNKG